MSCNKNWTNSIGFISFFVVWKWKDTRRLCGQTAHVCFPVSLKRVVRELIASDVVDQPDPTHDGVHCFCLLNPKCL